MPLFMANLNEYFSSKKPSERQKFKLCLHIAQALKGAHAAHVCFLDLKPENILIDRHNGAFICDFGTARNLREAQEKTFEGNQLYCAPEQISCLGSKNPMHATVAMDLWALGLILLEISYGFKANLFRLHSTSERQKTLQAIKKRLKNSKNPLKAPIMALLNEAPSQRPSAARICEILEEIYAQKFQPSRSENQSF